MKKNYTAPELVCDEFAPDTMIASANTKNGNPDNNQNCWGCNTSAGATDPSNPENSCFFLPGSSAYDIYC